MSAPAPANTYPFCQGLPAPVVTRLLSGVWKPGDYAAYLRCPHWEGKKAEAFQVHGRICMACGCAASLQVHHRGKAAYRVLFAEDVRRHLSIFCKGCHRKIHGR